MASRETIICQIRKADEAEPVGSVHETIYDRRVGHAAQPEVAVFFVPSYNTTSNSFIAFTFSGLFLLSPTRHVQIIELDIRWNIELIFASHPTIHDGPVCTRARIWWSRTTQKKGKRKRGIKMMKKEDAVFQRGEPGWTR